MFRFNSSVRAAAKARDNYLIGIHVTSPNPRSGTDFIQQTPAMSKEKTDVFSLFCINLLSGLNTPQEAFDKSFGSPDNANVDWSSEKVLAQATSSDDVNATP